VHARNDVRRHQAVAHALARIGTGANRRVHRARLAAHQHRHVTAAHELATDQAHFRRLRHRVRRLDRRYQSARLDHAQCDTVVFTCHRCVSC